MKRYIRKAPRIAISPLSTSEIASVSAVVGAGFYFASFILSHAWRGQKTELFEANALFIALVSIMMAFVFATTLKPEKWRSRAAKFITFMELRGWPYQIASGVLIIASALVLSRTVFGYLVFLSLVPMGLIIYGNMTKLARFAALYLLISGLWTFFLALFGRAI